MKNNIKNGLIAIVFLLSINNNLHASGIVIDESAYSSATEPADPMGDPGANPIDAYVLVLLFLGVGMGYLYYRKVPKSNN